MLQQQNSSGSSMSAPSSSFLKVSVTDPVKLGNYMDAYISYRVVTKANMHAYQWTDKIVIRRYRDFDWLHERLSEKYKGIFIPPLPEKSTVEKFRFSAEFIELRRRGLDVFINRIAAHPLLQQSDDLRLFLEANEETMERARTMDVNIFGKKSGDFMQLFKDVQSKVSGVVLGKEKPLEECDPEYEKFKRYILELEEIMGEAQKQSFRCVKKHREMADSFISFGKVIKQLGTCEGGFLGKCLSELGSQSELLSFKFHKEAHELLMNFEEPLKDFVRTIKSIQVTMEDRALAFKQLCDLKESAKLKEINVERLKATRQEHKVPEAEAEYKEAKAQCEAAEERMETIKRRMQEEIERFQEYKTYDFFLLVYNFSKGEAQLYRDIAEAWRMLRPKIDELTENTAATERI